MKNWPADPMRQHDHLIAALCEDMANGIFSLDGPNVRRVFEINRQINQSPREGSDPNKALPDDDE